MRRMTVFAGLVGGLLCLALAMPFIKADRAYAADGDSIPFSEIDPEGELSGTMIQFGKYEQDNDGSNGAEPIEWHAPVRQICNVDGSEEVKEHALLLVSSCCLDGMEPSWSGTDWYSMNVRNWLNQDFFRSAFTEEERARIIYADLREKSTEIYVDEEDETASKGNGEDPGKQIGIDRVFLFAGDEMSLIPRTSFIATPYAKSKGILTDSEDMCWAFLREYDESSISLGSKSNELGSESDPGNVCGILPGIWLYLDEICTDKETIIKVQNALNEMGFECGTADGIIGRKTAVAIKKYQHKKKMMESGLVTKILVEDLFPEEGSMRNGDAAEKAGGETGTDFTVSLTGERQIDLSAGESSAWIYIETDLDDPEQIRLAYDDEYLYVGKAMSVNGGYRYPVVSLKSSADWKEVQFMSGDGKELLSLQVKP